MKIAIRGHESRGKEVIQILESLGGVNPCNHLYGNNFNCYYEIHGGLITCMCTKSDNYKYYTLEEFEKEFPFKIGDIVLLKGINDPYVIIALEWYKNKLCYKLDNELRYSPNAITTYENMKEERNITLTLNKAKEWYKKGGELKEVALQAYTEEELTEVELPKTWEEFCENHPIEKGEAYIDDDSEINIILNNEPRDKEYYKNICPSKESAEAHLALMQLEQLRDCYRGLFVTVIGMPVWSIIMYNGKPHILQTMWGKNHSFLSFQSKEVAEKYLKNFKSLIEKAGDLI